MQTVSPSNRNDEEIQKVAECLSLIPHWQDRFFDLGYELPLLHIKQVDLLRCRPADENSLRFYSNEVLREFAYFQSSGVFWSPKNRKSLGDEKRSKYLDHLQEMVDEGNYAFLGKDGILLDRILDPNLIIFARWKLNDDLVPEMTWEDYLGLLKNQKRKEAIRKIPSRFREKALSAKKLGYGDILDLIKDYAAEVDLNTVLLERGTKPRIVVEAPIGGSELSVYLEWEDYYLLRKSGEISLRFVIRKPAGALWDRQEKSPYFTSLFGGLIPGAEYYSPCRGDAQLIALSIVAHMDFLRCARQVGDVVQA